MYYSSSIKHLAQPVRTLDETNDDDYLLDTMSTVLHPIEQPLNDLLSSDSNSILFHAATALRRQSSTHSSSVYPSDDDIFISLATSDYRHANDSSLDVDSSMHSLNNYKHAIGLLSNDSMHPHVNNYKRVPSRK
jgi:hypothetical protein